MRAGSRPMYRPVQLTAADASVNQPTTSTTTCTVPVPLRIVTLPSVPMPAMTRFATVPLAVKLRLEVPDGAPPLGPTESQLAALPPVAVTLRTTPDTPEVGTPPWPVTSRAADWFGPSGSGRPNPVRLSPIRAGVTARYSPWPVLTSPRE